jgi:hypothetical protein
LKNSHIHSDNSGECAIFCLAGENGYILAALNLDRHQSVILNFESDYKKWKDCTTFELGVVKSMNSGTILRARERCICMVLLYKERSLPRFLDNIIDLKLKIESRDPPVISNQAWLFDTLKVKQAKEVLVKLDKECFKRMYGDRNEENISK